MEVKKIIFLCFTSLVWISIISVGTINYRGANSQNRSHLQSVCRNVQKIIRLADHPENGRTRYDQSGKSTEFPISDSQGCSISDLVSFLSTLEGRLASLSTERKSRLREISARKAKEISILLKKKLQKFAHRCTKPNNLHLGKFPNDATSSSRGFSECSRLSKSSMRLSTSLRRLFRTIVHETDRAQPRTDDDTLPFDLKERLFGDEPRNSKDRPYPMEYDASSNGPIDPDTSRARTYDQYFDTSGLQRYLRSCNDCVEKTAANTCPLNLQVLEMKKWANQLQELFSFGCRRKDKCVGGGRCCIANRPPFGTTVVQMTQMLKDVYSMMMNECQNCADSQEVPKKTSSIWSTWSDCRADSEDSRRLTRTRRRGQPCSSSNQRSCLAEERETETCQIRQIVDGCCEENQWESWSEYSTCSQTCGSGSRTRFRKCRKLVPGRVCQDRKFPEVEIERVDCENLPACTPTTYVDPTIRGLSDTFRWDFSDCNCRTGLPLCKRIANRPSDFRVADDRYCERAQRDIVNPRCSQEVLEEQCPICITTCRGKTPGIYPACSGCNRYIQCGQSSGVQMECKDISDRPAEYDAVTQKCVPGTSNTCRLRDGIDDCTGVPDSRYHRKDDDVCRTFIQCESGQVFVRPCPPELEFDQLEQRCISRSSTCRKKIPLPGGIILPDFGGRGELPKPPFPDYMGIVIGGVL